jgi:hypothetical protein
VYTHEWYSQDHILLGCGDSTIRHIELRMNKKAMAPLSDCVDPYVPAIGDIVYNRYSNAFVTSGLSE